MINIFPKKIRNNLDSYKLLFLNFLSSILFENYPLIWSHITWFKNKKFFNMLNTGLKNDDKFNAHRKWNLSQMCRLVEFIPGDIAECGVYKGSSAKIISSSFKNKNKTLYLFDSFEGLSQPLVRKDGMYWKKGNLVSTLSEAKKSLKNCEMKIVFKKGWIPTRFDEVKKKRFSFVHVDVDLYEPTYESLNFFYKRINNGGVLICDDYGFETCPGATTAVDKFLENKPEKMILLSTGGGFFIKGKKTSINKWV